MCVDEGDIPITSQYNNHTTCDYRCLKSVALACLSISKSYNSAKHILTPLDQIKELG